MKALAQDIIRAAHTALQDDGTRWPAGELVLALCDGQRQLASLRPSEVAHTETFTPVEGGRQTLPDDAMTLLEVRCLTDGRMRALTQVDRHALESVQPDWASLQPTPLPVHYMYSPLEPRVFYLYRPVTPDARVELTYARYPADVAAPSGATADTVTGETAFEAKWANALRDYVLYRAYAKDAEYAGNATLAAGYFAAFNDAVKAGAAPAAPSS
jgi:hypothetical protein